MMPFKAIAAPFKAVIVVPFKAGKELCSVSAFALCCE